MLPDPISLVIVIAIMIGGYGGAITIQMKNRGEWLACACPLKYLGMFPPLLVLVGDSSVIPV